MVLSVEVWIVGVVFIGLIVMVQVIVCSMVQNLIFGMLLIVEIGGLNVMIVDLIVLLEQVVCDIVNGVFCLVGQCCLVLCCFYVQEDIVLYLIQMIKGVMDELVVGDLWDLCIDVGLVIDIKVCDDIVVYIVVNKVCVVYELFMFV